MKKILITIFLMFIIIYPPHFSKAGEETTKTSVLNYLIVKNEVMKYQIQKKLDIFYQLYDSLKLKK